MRSQTPYLEAADFDRFAEGECQQFYAPVMRRPSLLPGRYFRLLQGLLLKPDAPAARNDARHSLLCGSPATVAEAIAEIDTIGVGGLILAFRIGPMPGETAEQSIRLFMQKVAPEFR